MGSGLKKKGPYKGLNTGFTPSKEQTKWLRYCVDNNIRISPVPTQTRYATRRMAYRC